VSDAERLDCAAPVRVSSITSRSRPRKAPDSVAASGGNTPEPHRDEQEGRDRHHHDQREQRGQHHHDDQGDDQQSDVAVRDSELLQEHLDQRQVDRRPGHDVARTHLVAAARAEVLQMVVHPDLQLALNADRGPPADGAAQVVEYEAGQAHADEDAQPQREGAFVHDDCVVEDDRLDVRDQAEQPHRDDGERHPPPRSPFGCAGSARALEGAACRGRGSRDAPTRPVDPVGAQRLLLPACRMELS
jgi:hypothetical protein